MDTLLENQVIALSALVSARPEGEFDFEISPFFLNQYKGLKPFGFFRFINPITGEILRESPQAPLLSCNAQKLGTRDIQVIKNNIINENKVFRIRTIIFQPEIDPDWKGSLSFIPSKICLVVGLDEAPYISLVMNTLFSTIPIVLILVIFLIGILLLLVRGITKDLSRLTSIIEVADFGATHKFPVLFDAQTLEVKAVIEKLIGLHTQAADVYQEMWLFLGRAAHQLKTPVTAIQATLQVLLRKERTKEELRLGLLDVEIAANQLSNLTKKLISSSRISYQESSAHREEIEFSNFILDQVKMFSSQAEQFGVSIRVVTRTSLKISANYFLVAEIFGNLIENAILYSPRGVGSSVEISWQIENQNALIFISDQGRGFSAHSREVLFKPFVRGDEREIGGSGLGLFNAKKSAHLLSGDILICETSSEGSKIAVTLPLWQS
jgi:signal transduction histidine kinase